ncbi:hypothetical protein CPC08DRAFT_428672 [Agrocybe pediades]|nr:hypothetical protein CPC08DRAFT_428672 [Agrocybe pediades]
MFSLSAAPSTQLPFIKAIKQTPKETLEDAVQYLRLLYNPPVRGTRRKKLGNFSKQPNHSQELDTWRGDEFERSYAMKWLTALVVQCGSEEDDADEDSECLQERNDKAALIEKAAALLAVCAGTASAGIITRRFDFAIPHDAAPITVDLTDVPLDNQDYGSVGAQTWGGAYVMAEMIAESPSSFYIQTRRTKVRGLELGGGTGLVSLTAAKVAKRLNVDMEIVATDYHPSVLANLEQNIESNSGCAQVTACHLDWSKLDHISPVLEEPFDVMYGADIVYEAQHARWIKECLLRLLRKPCQSNPDPTFHLIIPLRATHSAESKTIEQVFKKESKSDLVIKYKENIICDTETGRDGEEVEYAYFRIGWDGKS